MAHVEAINELLAAHAPLLECVLKPEKGRTIVLRYPVAGGSVLYSGDPLFIVKEERDHPLFVTIEGIKDKEFESIWYWCALKTLTEVELKALSLQIISESAESKQKLFLMLFAPENETVLPGTQLLAEKLGIIAHPELFSKFDRFLNIWRFNCFEHSDDPLGFSVHFLPSFLSHSCNPNSMWVEDPQSGQFSLRTRHNIQKGEELTISYLSEDFLAKPTQERRDLLESTKCFTCSCQRCAKLNSSESIDKELKLLWESLERGDSHITPSNVESITQKLESKKSCFYLTSLFDAVSLYFLSQNNLKESTKYLRMHVAGLVENLQGEEMNASYAWALEKLGDYEKNLEIYTKAHGILSVLFGESHEYSLVVSEKMKNLQISS
jgi:SET domain